MAGKELSAQIAGRIRGICLEKGMSLACLARRSGVSLSTVRRLANGNSGNARIETIIRLCRSLGISLGDFWADVQPEQSNPAQ